MNLEQLGKKDRHLTALLQQAQQWQRLDGKIKALFPANLRAHFQTANIGEGRLNLLATNNMAASRLRMIAPALLPQLQNLSPEITEVRIKTVPNPPPPPKKNTLHLSSTALENLEKAAGRLKHHPELADALEKLIVKHRR